MPIRVPQLPGGLRWDHNAYYHPLILRRIPVRVGSALDVGCGTGALARRLATRADRVAAVDPDAGMISAAESGAAPRISWLHGDVLDLELPEYDVVTALSSLHHLPLRAGLTRLKELVAPGGTLVVVGLYRMASAADFALEPVSLAANLGMGGWLAARGRAGKPNDDGMPVRQPRDTLAEIGALARELLPGSVLRRQLFWRYSLVWRRGRS